MSNALLLGLADPFNPGRDGYNITVTLNEAKGSTLIGTGGCVFGSSEDANPESLALYMNYQGKVTVLNNMADEFLAVFGANTKNKTAYGEVTLDRPIEVDVLIGNIHEQVTVIAAGQTSGTFTVELPVSGSDPSLQEARKLFKANAGKATAAR